MAVILPISRKTLYNQSINGYHHFEDLNIENPEYIEIYMCLGVCFCKRVCRFIGLRW